MADVRVLLRVLGHVTKGDDLIKSPNWILFCQNFSCVSVFKPVQCRSSPVQRPCPRLTTTAHISLNYMFEPRPHKKRSRTARRPLSRLNNRNRTWHHPSACASTAMNNNQGKRMKAMFSRALSVLRKKRTFREEMTNTWSNLQYIRNSTQLRLAAFKLDQRCRFQSAAGGKH